MLSRFVDKSGKVDFSLTLVLQRPAKMALNSRACIIPYRNENFHELIFLNKVFCSNENHTLSFFMSKSHKQFHLSVFVG